jgi:hypothetical protein
LALLLYCTVNDLELPVPVPVLYSPLCCSRCDVTSHYFPLFSTGSPNDICCLQKDSHLPSCTRCTEGFSIISELQEKINGDLTALQQSYAAPEEEQVETTTPLSGSPAPPKAPVDWSSLTLHELRKACSDQNMTCTGRQGKLIERLAQYDEAAVEEKYSFWMLDFLKAECKRRKLAQGGTKPDLVIRLKKRDKEIKDYNLVKIRMRPLSTEELLALQRLEELRYDIDSRKNDLVEFRSHLARHLSEEAKAKEELANLADDEAIVTSDYKMKILSCFFRENQKKWFGKRGTSMLGFMITTNPTDDEQRAKGVKEVNFVMMVTDDTLQDEHGVACAKAIVYKNYLPKHIKKVRFVSDGAGCFKSKYHRALMPFWKLWVGVDEISLRITPAGDGKSCLDGMFGRMNRILQTSVDGGKSYWNSVTILEAIESTSGMTATEFIRFEPDRECRLDVEIEGISLEAVLTTTLDPSREHGNQTVLAYKHTGFGLGNPINLASSQVIYAWRRGAETKKKKAKLVPMTDVYDNDVGTTKNVCFYFN